MQERTSISPAPADAPAPQAGTPESLAEGLGARIAVDACGSQALFPAAPPERIAAGFACLLPDLGLLTVTGADASSFLHNQLSNDVEHLADAAARWFGYCSPKGRLLTTLLGWRDGDGFTLALSRPRAAPIGKRLSMYVLRAKARVVDVSEQELLVGIGGEAASSALGVLGLAAPAPMAVARAAGIVAIGLPPAVIDPAQTTAPVPRWLLRVAPSQLDAVWRTLSAALVPVSTAIWRYTEVRSAIPRIVEATSEQFVPQMINLEVSGGVDFRKGCYPGQEVVARTQYLGKLKRRMLLGHVDGAAPAPGTDVAVDGATEPVGLVVLAADAPAGGADLLFEVRLDALGSAHAIVDGMRIDRLRLPYEVPGL